MNKISRRTFIAGASALAGTVYVGSVQAQAPVEPTSLAEALSSGALPPITERLPANPLVIAPLERVGQYGGDWHNALVGGGGSHVIVRCQGYEPLVRFNEEWTGLVENTAEHFEANADGTEFTFRLRKGHRWSDGEPFTTADVQFWYDALFNDKEASLGGNGWWYTNGDPGRIEIVDEQTFRVIFSAPNGFFVHQLAWAQQDQLTRTPKHYLEKFHIRYNPDADKLAKEAGLESWIALFQREAGFADDTVFFQSSGRPTLNAWSFNNPSGIAPGQNTEQAIAVRNPYYFKIDPDGNQLPYMDRVIYQLVADPQVLLLKTLQGDIDMMDQYIGTPTNKPVLFDGQEAGDYRFYTLTETASNTLVFQLNLNHVDPTKNALFNTREFRQALSVAIDRQALIDAIFVGQGTPAQASIREGDPLYNERLAKEWTEYDPAKANMMLDALLPNKDGDGFRLDQSGQRLTVVFELDQSRTTFIDMFQLVIPMFQAVGIDAQVRSMDRSLWETRVRSGREFDATAHTFGANSGVAAMLDARYFVPTIPSSSLFARGWSIYFTDPSDPEAVEPPAEIKAQQDLYRTLLAAANPAEQLKIMAEVLEKAADMFLTFGVSLPPDGYGVVKNNMVNVPDTMPNSYGWPTPGPARPEQFFKA